MKISRTSSQVAVLRIFGWGQGFMATTLPHSFDKECPPSSLVGNILQ